MIKDRLYILAIFLLTACGDSPTDPKGERLPNVAGTYTGEVVFTAYTLSPDPLYGTGELVVVQVNEQVTVAPSMTFSGETTTFEEITGVLDPEGIFSITEAAITQQEEGYDPICGDRVGSGASLIFYTNTVKISLSWSTSLCGSITLSGTLTLIK